MGVSYGPTTIITDGLVLCLDAANPKSYSGTGTSWNDVYGPHTATITGATHNSDKGGCFIFDGANDYAKIDDSSDFLFGTGSFTEEAWHKRGGNTTWEAPIVRGNEASWGGLWIDGYGTFRPYHYTESSGSNINFDTGEAAGTDWMHHVTTTTNTGSAVIVKVYKNGVLQGSQTTSVSGWQPKNTSVGTDIYIGGIFGASYWYEGKIAVCRIYKGKALSAAEVLKNYDALKGRFV